MADGFQFQLAPPNIPPVSTDDTSQGNVLELPAGVYQRPPRFTTPGYQSPGIPQPFRTPGFQGDLLGGLQQVVAHQESGGQRDPYLTEGKKGEIGKYQIMPATAAQFGFSPEALRASPQLQDQAFKIIMGSYLQRFGGDPGKALQAWNAGPGSVGRGVSSQVSDYVKKGLSRLGGLFEGTAYAEEPPGGPGAPSGPFTRAPTTYLRGGPSKGGPAGPADINRLMAVTSHLSADRQRRILEKAQQQNREFEEQQKDIAADRAHPTFGRWWRRPATKAAQKVLEWGFNQQGIYDPKAVPEMARSWAHTLVPQTPTMAAIQLATLPMGAGEMAPALEGEEATLEGLPALKEAARQAFRTFPRRMLYTGTVGGVTQAATGDYRHPLQEFASGAETGLAAQGIGEAIGLPLGGLGRIAGQGPLLEQTEREVSDELAKNLPATLDGRPYTMQDFKTPGKVVEDVNETLNPARQRIYQAVKNKKYAMPIVKGANPDKWVWPEDGMSLQNAEEQLSKMTDLAYAKGGLKTTVRAREIRELADRLKADIAQGLGPYKQSWLAIRAKVGSAYALKRLFSDYPIIDPETGTIDQPELVKGIKANWDDLRRQLGRDGVQGLWNRATRVGPNAQKWYTRGAPGKGYADRPAQLVPHLRFHEGEWLPSISLLPHTYRPIGNVPIWMYPPRAPLTALVGAPAANSGMTTPQLPQRVNPTVPQP